MCSQMLSPVSKKVLNVVPTDIIKKEFVMGDCFWYFFSIFWGEDYFPHDAVRRAFKVNQIRWLQVQEMR